MEGPQQTQVCSTSSSAAQAARPRALLIASLAPFPTALTGDEPFGKLLCRIGTYFQFGPQSSKSAVRLMAANAEDGLLKGLPENALDEIVAVLRQSSDEPALHALRGTCCRLRAAVNARTRHVSAAATRVRGERFKKSRSAGWCMSCQGHLELPSAPRRTLHHLLRRPLLHHGPPAGLQVG